MNGLRRDFGKRLKHERPLVHERVRDREVRRADDLVAVEQQVKINDARLPLLTSNSAELPLDVEKKVQQLLGGKVSLNLGDRVQKWRRRGRAADGGVFQQ